jgi:hypothetical protein
LTRDAIVTDVAAGPAPTAIAASTNAVFVAEGEPDTGPPGQPRTQVLERLDPTSLAVERSVAAPSVVDVTLTPGLVWTVTTSGLVVAYDDTALAKRWSFQLDGRGRASVSADSNQVWAVIGSIDDAGSGHYVVGRIDAATGVAMEPIEVPGDGVGPTIIAGRPAWLAIADDPIHDRLYAMNLDGSLHEVGSIPPPAGMSRDDQAIWSLGVDGSITIFDASSGERITSGAARSSGAALAVSGDAAYLAIGDQVDVLEPFQQ